MKRIKNILFQEGKAYPHPSKDEKSREEILRLRMQLGSPSPIVFRSMGSEDASTARNPIGLLLLVVDSNLGILEPREKPCLCRQGLYPLIEKAILSVVQTVVQTQ